MAWIYFKFYFLWNTISISKFMKRIYTYKFSLRNKCRMYVGRMLLTLWHLFLSLSHYPALYYIIIELTVKVNNAISEQLLKHLIRGDKNYFSILIQNCIIEWAWYLCRIIYYCLIFMWVYETQQAHPEYIPWVCISK